MFSERLLEPVKEWANVRQKSFMPNGYGRQFLILSRDNCPSVIWDIKEQVVAQYKLHNEAQEPVYKDFCGYITEGGQVHKHRDNNQKGLIHTRFNVLVQKPQSGGIPVINDVELEVAEGDIWVCRAGLDYHSSTQVIGNKARIVLSFGFLLGAGYEPPKY